MEQQRPHTLGSRAENPTPGKREVDLYTRTYATLLQSSGTVGVSSLEPAHISVASSLHSGATEREPDMNAFLYSAQRLPACIGAVNRIVLGQTVQAFARAGYRDYNAWERQSAPGRRRTWHFDGDETLAATIASASDLDDLIPTIVAYQIEWNKLHAIIAADEPLGATITAAAADPVAAPGGAALADVGARLLLDSNDWDRLQTVWGDALWANLQRVATIRKRYSLRMLGGAFTGYNRTARQWWEPVQRHIREHGLEGRPVYLVSSNMHGIANVMSGTAIRRREALSAFIRSQSDRGLIDELDQLERGTSRSSWENLLYFGARRYFAARGNEQEAAAREREEHERGLTTIPATGAVDVGVQVLDLRQADPASFDPRLLAGASDSCLAASTSDAVIVNVNYPLGLSAYHLFAQMAISIDQLRGVYILGKAATLNGRIGDVMLANVVYDEHSGNTYWFENCFAYADVAPYLVYGAALDNQKAVTVKGTYLQNQGYLDFYYRENFTVVEMEAGPYLNAIYEDRFLRRYPEGEAINLQQHAGEKIDLGIIHYASDTPYTRAHTLGARGMSYHGMDSTYASTIAILRRVFTQAGILPTNAGAGQS
jgi:hypothetical protein